MTFSGVELGHGYVGVSGIHSGYTERSEGLKEAESVYEVGEPVLRKECLKVVRVWTCSRAR